MAIYVVDPTTGSDSNPGTQTSPFASLIPFDTGSGFITLQANDAVYIRGTVRNTTSITIDFTNAVGTSGNTTDYIFFQKDPSAPTASIVGAKGQPCLQTTAGAVSSGLVISNIDFVATSFNTNAVILNDVQNISCRFNSFTGTNGAQLLVNVGIAAGGNEFVANDYKNFTGIGLHIIGNAACTNFAIQSNEFHDAVGAEAGIRLEAIHDTAAPAQFGFTVFANKWYDMSATDLCVLADDCRGSCYANHVYRCNFTQSAFLVTHNGPFPGNSNDLIGYTSFICNLITIPEIGPTAAIRGAIYYQGVRTGAILNNTLRNDSVQANCSTIWVHRRGFPTGFVGPDIANNIFFNSDASTSAISLFSDSTVVFLFQPTFFPPGIGNNWYDRDNVISFLFGAPPGFFLPNSSLATVQVFNLEALSQVLPGADPNLGLQAPYVGDGSNIEDFRPISTGVSATGNGTNTDATPTGPGVSIPFVDLELVQFQASAAADVHVGAILTPVFEEGGTVINPTTSGRAGSPRLRSTAFISQTVPRQTSRGDVPRIALNDGGHGSQPERNPLLYGLGVTLQVDFNAGVRTFTIELEGTVAGATVTKDITSAFVRNNIDTTRYRAEGALGLGTFTLPGLVQADYATPQTHTLVVRMTNVSRTTEVRRDLVILDSDDVRGCVSDECDYELMGPLTRAGIRIFANHIKEADPNNTAVSFFFGTMDLLHAQVAAANPAAGALTTTVPNYDADYSVGIEFDKRDKDNAECGGISGGTIPTSCDGHDCCCQVIPSIQTLSVTEDPDGAATPVTTGTVIAVGQVIELDLTIPTVGSTGCTGFQLLEITIPGIESTAGYFNLLDGNFPSGKPTPDVYLDGVLLAPGVSNDFLQNGVAFIAGPGQGTGSDVTIRFSVPITCGSVIRIVWRMSVLLDMTSTPVTLGNVLFTDSGPCDPSLHSPHHGVTSLITVGGSLLGPPIWDEMGGTNEWGLEGPGVIWDENTPGAGL